MPTTSEDAWLFPGDYITKDTTYCGACGTFDHNDEECAAPPKPKWLPTTNIIVIRTGAPTVLLFDNDSSQKRFAVGGDYQYDRFTLRRYDEVWERITPGWATSAQRGRGSGLKIRYCNDDGTPMNFETDVSSVMSKFTVASKSHKYFAISVRRGEGTRYHLFGGDGDKQWSMDLVYGRLTVIRNLRIDGSAIRYDLPGDNDRNGKPYGIDLHPDSIFDYGTGERIVHAPSYGSVMAKS